MKPIIFKSILLAFIASLILAEPAYAYIDPNTGGIVFQVLAVIFTLFTSILLFFSSRLRMGFARFSRFVRDLFRR